MTIDLRPALTPSPFVLVESGGPTRVTVNSVAPTVALGLFPPGMSGSGGGGVETSIMLIGGEAIGAGQPAYIDKVTGKALLARADVFTKSDVIGLASAFVANGFTGQFVREEFTLADWTPVTGSTFLSVGQRYYLSTAPGQITTTPPATVGQAVAFIGLAIGPTTIEIAPSAPILL